MLASGAVRCSTPSHYSRSTTITHPAPNGGACRVNPGTKLSTDTVHATNTGGGYTRAPHCDAICKRAVYSVYRTRRHTMCHMEQTLSLTLLLQMAGETDEGWAVAKLAVH